MAAKHKRPRAGFSVRRIRAGRWAVVKTWPEGDQDTVGVWSTRTKAGTAAGALRHGKAPPSEDDPLPPIHIGPSAKHTSRPIPGSVWVGGGLVLVLLLLAFRRPKVATP